MTPVPTQPTRVDDETSSAVLSAVVIRWGLSVVRAPQSTLRVDQLQDDQRAPGDLERVT